MTPKTDVCTIVTYLEDIISTLGGRGIPVETGFVSANRRTGRSLTITLGNGLTRLSHATLSWQPGLGWSLTSQQLLPPHVMPLGTLTNPDEIAGAVHDLITSLATPTPTIRPWAAHPPQGRAVTN